MRESLLTDYTPPRKLKKPAKYVITPDMHVKIKKVYMDKSMKSGEVTDIAEKLGIPRWKVTRYAIRKGWISKQKKEPCWSEREINILKWNAMHSPEVIQKKLKKYGFTRGVTGIVLKRKRLRLLSNLPGQTANSLAMCLGEDVHFVLKAINDGELKAKRREMNRTEQQGGNFYYITDSNVRDFIINNIHKIDLRKVDKYWFVDVLTGQ